MESHLFHKLNLSFISPPSSNEQNLSVQSDSECTITFEKALSLVNKLVFAERGRYLTEPEILVMRGTWENLEFVEIAEDSPYSVNYLQRSVASRLWDILSKLIGNGQRVSKKNFQYFLERFAKDSYANLTSSLDEEKKITANTSIQVTRGQLPDVSNFYGRTSELSLLKELIIKQRQRCIVLIGVPGIGKSALAAKLLAEINIEDYPRFDHLIWKSVSHAPSVQELVLHLMELIQPLPLNFCSENKSHQEIITEFIRKLQSSRHLVVIDGSEALFQRNNFEQRLEYGLFFRRLVEEVHQSCLVLTSQFLPDEINSLIALDQPIQSVRIEGLDTDTGLQLLSAQGLNDLEECEKLIKTYRGNPLELKTVTNRIHHFFTSPKAFFEDPTTLVSDHFQQMLNQIFRNNILSKTEHQIMIYLAQELASKSTLNITFTNLLIGINNKFVTPISTSEFIKALETLEKYSLIENDKDTVTKEINFTLQPVIKKYILTDPLGLVRASNTSSLTVMAS